MFEIEMLPAREGDCLWLRYGDSKNIKQILIDGGRAATAKIVKKRLAALPLKAREFELLIITHVDRDHIEGILNIIEDPRSGVKFKDIWFNGYHHLHDGKIETFGPAQGERLSRALIKKRLPWNKRLRGNAVCVRGNRIPKIRIAGGLTLSLLSPDAQKLKDLIPEWEKECKKAGLMAGAKGRASESKSRFEILGTPDIETLARSPFEKDPKAPNGSSIAVLAQYKGKSVLLAADAHVDRLLESLNILKGSARRLRIDAFKVPHHGSHRNASKELLELLKCRHYLVSTNGSYFEHPSMTAIARVVKFGGKGLTLHFNYRSNFNKMWAADGLRSRYGYKVRYPDKSVNGTLKLSL
jgi:beta-lactamase superfamily II metal-dependent hydrolase